MFEERRKERRKTRKDLVEDCFGFYNEAINAVERSQDLHKIIPAICPVWVAGAPEFSPQTERLLQWWLLGKGRQLLREVEALERLLVLQQTALHPHT